MGKEGAKKLGKKGGTRRKRSALPASLVVAGKDEDDASDDEDIVRLNISVGILVRDLDAMLSDGSSKASLPMSLVKRTLEEATVERNIPRVVRAINGETKGMTTTPKGALEGGNHEEKVIA